MIPKKASCRTFILTLFAGALALVAAGPGWDDRLPPEVEHSVLHWWRGEGRSGSPKTHMQVASAAGRHFMLVYIDEPDYRGATGNETFFLYLQESGRWRQLLSTIGLGYYVRRGGPGGRPWIETFAHDSAAVAAYQLWRWDNRKRAYTICKDWEGPYPEKLQFVLPPGGLPHS